MSSDLATKPSVPPRRPLKTRSAAWPKVAARLLTKIGLRPNQVSVLSIVFAGIAAGCIVESRGRSGFVALILLLIAAGMIQCRLICNLLDGLMAVEGGLKTKTGDLYNDLPDRISDSVILVCVGYAVPSCSWAPTAGWLAALLAALTAYVRLLGAAAGTTQYFIGPMAKQQRMGLLTAACILAGLEAIFLKQRYVLPASLVIIVGGCVVTLFRRLHRIANDLNSS